MWCQCPGHILLDGDRAHPSKKGYSPQLSAHVYIAAKRSPISATAELLLTFMIQDGGMLL